MLRRLGRHIRHNVVAWLALFVALGGSGAYAANTIGSGDIIDNQVTTNDVRDDNLGFGGLYQQDLGAGSVSTSELQDNSVLSVDLHDDNVLSADIKDNTLTGADINESTLAMPPTTTATIAGQGSVNVGDTYTKIIGRTLPAGNYAIVATANLERSFFGGTHVQDTLCELRNASGQFIGGARDRRDFNADTYTVSLSMNGVAQLSGTGEVGLYCRAQDGAVGDGQMEIIRLDGTF